MLLKNILVEEKMEKDYIQRNLRLRWICTENYSEYFNQMIEPVFISVESECGGSSFCQHGKYRVIPPRRSGRWIFFNNGRIICNTNDYSGRKERN